VKITYKKAGVDIKKAEDFAKKISLSRIRAFGSLFNLKSYLKKFKNPVLVASADFFLDYIACGKLDTKVLGQIIEGIKKGLKSADCLLIGGETAEMPGMYKKDEYDLAGFCVGLVDKDRIIDGKRIKQGDLVIGLESSGLHSNGFSLVRKVFGPKEIKKYAKDLLKPTRIYVKPILSLLSTRYSLLSTVRGIAHITGGAFYNKATKILSKGLGLVIYKKSWSVPIIFELIQEKTKLDDKEMYSVFNMGIGMILVVDKNSAEKINSNLNIYCKSYIIGEIVRAKEKISLI